MPGRLLTRLAKLGWLGRLGRLGRRLTARAGGSAFWQDSGLSNNNNNGGNSNNNNNSFQVRLLARHRLTTGQLNAAIHHAASCATARLKRLPSLARRCCFGLRAWQMYAAANQYSTATMLAKPSSLGLAGGSNFAANQTMQTQKRRRAKVKRQSNGLDSWPTIARRRQASQPVGQLATVFEAAPSDWRPSGRPNELERSRWRR